MRRSALAAFAAILAFTTADPAQAQSWRFDLGVNGGFAWYGESLDPSHTGVNGEAQFDPGFLVGAQATLWLTPTIGLRANAAFSERPLEFDGQSSNGVPGDDFNLVEDVNLWSGTGDLMIRFLGNRESSFIGFNMIPYIALGVGAKWVNPACNGFTTNETETTAAGCGPAFTATGEDADVEGAVFTINNRSFLLEEKSTLMGLVALGSDLRLARNLGLRLEVGDRIWDTPIRAVTRTNNTIAFTEPDGEDVGDTVHEIYGTAGLHFLFGVTEPERVTIVEPAPAPPPVIAPVEETITVCVIDPTVPGGIRHVTATFIPSTGDTLVVVNGQRVALRTTTGNVMVASSAEWFVRGEPLTLHVNGETLEFVTFGGSRIVDANDLAFLGTVNGVPVYADEDEVQDVLEELDEARKARADNDLDKILEEREDLREDLEDLGMLYIPLQPTGCVFQPVQRVEEVRKVRG